MANENLHTLSYQVVRYTPDLIRDEWVNIGIILEQTDGARRRRVRTIQDAAEIARVRRLHPDADEAVLNALAVNWESHMGTANDAADAYLKKMEDTLSNVIQLTPRRTVLAEDFDAEFDRLYESRVSPPARRTRSGAILESTRAWIRTRLNDVFRRRRILARMERNVRVEEYTQSGDPMRLDYGYRVNGTRGFLQSFSLSRDAAQAKALAYTAESIRVRIPRIEFTAITETPPEPSNPRHQFVMGTLAQQNIQIVPLSRMEAFAEELRLRLN